MRFDIHAHFGHWHHWPIPQTTGEAAVALMDRHSIARAAIGSLRGMYGDGREANVETLQLTERYPDRLVPVASLSPMVGGGGAMTELARRGFKAVRLYPALHGYTPDDPYLDEVCAAAAEAGVVVILPTRPMMNWRFSAVPIAQLRAAVARNPATRFVVSGPNYLLELRSTIQLLRACPNATVEISCFQGFGAVARLAAAVGADRVLFGTGLPLHCPACAVAKLDHAELSESDRLLIAHDNAARLLGLPS